MGVSNIISHSGLPGLVNDDHTQYLRADGVRALAGPWNMADQEVSNINLLTGDIANAVTHSQWDAAYAHSQDNSQAHSDYLVNNGSDETSGVLTAAGFTTTGTVQADHFIAKDLLLNLSAADDLYKFQLDAGGGKNLALVNETTNANSTVFRLYPPTADGTKPTIFQLNSGGTVVNSSNAYRFSFTQSTTQALIITSKSGAGDATPIMIGTNGFENLTLNVNGTITASGHLDGQGTAGFTLTSGDLNVASGNLNVDENSRLGGSSGDITIINQSYSLPQDKGTLGFLVRQTSTGDPDEWGYVNPASLGVAIAVLARTVTVTNSTDETSFIAMFDSATGNLPIRTETGLTYNSATKSLGIGGSINVADTIDSTGANLKLMQTASGDVTLFEDTDIAAGVDGPALSIHRKSAPGDGGDSFFRLVLDQNKQGILAASDQFKFSSGGSATFEVVGNLNFKPSNSVFFTFNNQAFFQLVDNAGAAKVQIQNGDRDTVAFIDSAGLGSFKSAVIGDGTNELQVSATGDLLFAGTGGFIEGHMTIPSVDIVVDTSGTTDPVEVADDGTGVPDAGDGWASVYQNEVTFAVSDLHYQTVTIPATYKVIWDMSPKTAAGGGTVIHGGIMIDGVAVRDNGEGHAHIFNANDNIQINGIGVIDCPNGNEEISLWVSNNANQKTLIEHGNMNIQLIGGT